MSALTHEVHVQAALDLLYQVENITNGMADPNISVPLHLAQRADLLVKMAQVHVELAKMTPPAEYVRTVDITPDFPDPYPSNQKA